MGMTDYVRVLVCCPGCGLCGLVLAHTNDLGRLGFTYSPLPLNWETFEFGKLFRTGLPVHPEFPLDKSAEIWKDQAEKIEAQATILKGFWGKLNYITVSWQCSCCREFYTGRIQVREGKLRGWGEHVERAEGKEGK